MTGGDWLAGWRFARRLKRLANADGDARPLADYAKGAWPVRGSPAREAPFLALDFELDGLGAGAHVLQAGWLPFDASGIPLAGAEARDIRSGKTLDDVAVTVHGIGEERARKGEPLVEVMPELLRALSGRIVIAHGASIERDVLSRTTRKLYGTAPPVRSICTLAIERKLHPGLVGSEPYRLATARSRYNLPPHGQHDALGDALAAAELFLAQLSRLPADTSLGSLERLAVGH
ncbi:MAG: 3'-5' exonuclease [Altererythrobacter sp.]